MADARSVVECGYTLHVPELEWLESVCDALHQAFGIGASCAGYVYDATVDRVEVGEKSAGAGRLVDTLAGNSALHFSEPTCVASAEWVLVCAAGADGKGAIFGFDVDRRFRGLVAHTREALVGVAAHLSAAHRLRAAIGQRDCSGEGALVDAVRRLVDPKPRDPSQSRAEWRALLNGRWSVLDRADRDGKRMIVARRNHVAGRDVLALRDVERRVLALAALGHSNKAIAMELDLAPSTVTAHLKRGLGRLGLASRVELVALQAQRGKKG